MGTCDRVRHRLGTNRLVDPDGILAGKSEELPGEERLGGEVAAVLLAHHDDEGNPVDARRRERADRVSEAGSRVQDRERGLAPPDRPARRHAHDRALVQRKHEAKVAGQVGEQLDLRRAGVREESREPVLAKDVERRVTDGLGHARSLRDAI
jgi:hypothetical protein